MQAVKEYYLVKADIDSSNNKMQHAVVYAEHEGGEVSGPHVVSRFELKPATISDEVRAAISHGKEGERGWLAMAERHGGLVKPDIGKHITHALAHSCCRAICEPARPERPPPSGGRTGTGALVRG